MYARSTAQVKEPAMDHCAIDVGGRKSQICVRDSAGTIQFEGAWETQALGDHLRQLPRCRVILETAAESFRIADQARAAGHDVRVVPATLVRTLGVGARRTKTDKRDARALSEVSTRIELPSVHIPSARSREWKTMASVHDALVSCRTKLINNVRGWLRGQARKPRSGAAESFAERVRALGELPVYITSELKMIDALSEEIDASVKRIAAATKADPVCKRLMTVPGVGSSTALRFVAALDVVTRFARAHEVESYLGLSPGEKSSSERQQRLGITKAGSASVRWVLIQAAWILKTCCRAPAARNLQLWAAEVEKRRGKGVAIVALARKLAGILFALWRDGTEFKTC
jgi:transposase